MNVDVQDVRARHLVAKRGGAIVAIFALTTLAGCVSGQAGANKVPYTAIVVTSPASLSPSIHSTSIVFEGTATPGATVLLSSTDSPQVTAGPNGRWQARLQLFVGANPVSVTAKGPAPGESSKSFLSYTITRTQTPAEIGAAKAAAAAEASRTSETVCGPTTCGSTTTKTCPTSRTT